MEILKTIPSYTKTLDLSFVLIGGHAVNFYGISRQTGDINLLTDRGQKAKWNSLLKDLLMEHSLPDDLILTLPDAPDFISKPPEYSMLEMAKLCESMLKCWNKSRFEKNLDPPPAPFTLL